MTSKAKLLGCLKMLGIDPKLETFTERKLLQKLVYLLQVFGVKLGFDYDWYLHGPYSPSLTRTLYEIIELKQFPHEELNSTEIARINKLKSFLGDDILSSDKLELLVSIHYIREREGATTASEEEVRKVIQKVKPYFSYKEIQDCWQKSIELEKMLS
jgi:uncharacterized protein YwgA